MNTQQDFELTAEEIDELKKFLARQDITINNTDKKPDFSALNELLEIKQYLQTIKTLFVYGVTVGISKLPNSIQYLTQLEDLTLYCCRSLTTLPETIGQLKNLRRLHINLCDIKKLPDSIVALKELTELHIISPDLSELPENIGELNKIQKLSISGRMGTTTLNHLPDSIKNLTDLKKLHISGLPYLTALPDSMGELTALKYLEIWQCKRLSSIPASIAQLPKLRKFEIIECHSLNDIPERIQQLTCFACYAYRSERLERPLTGEQKQAKKVLAQVKKDTATPFIKIKAKKAKKLPLTASKFGGVPYWQPEMPYPVDKNGEKLALLAQIDLAELPPLPDFPTTGLLQFFISNDDVAGLDFDNPLSQTGWRVVYHASVNPNISEKEVLNLSIPLENMPLGDTQYQLSFDLGSQSMGLADYRFEKLFKTTAEKLKIEFDEDDELLDLIEEEAYDKLHNSTAGHHIGGYPFFTQSDPRGEEPLTEHNILLLQIDSKNGIMWGDAGVGNFFITADDLKKRDFSRVLYHWDCA